MLADDPWEWRAAWLGGPVAAGQRRPRRGPRVVQRRLRPGAGRARPEARARDGVRTQRRAGDRRVASTSSARAPTRTTRRPPRSGWPASASARGDLEGALHALDLVASTRSSYVDARVVAPSCSPCRPRTSGAGRRRSPASRRCRRLAVESRAQGDVLGSALARRPRPGAVHRRASAACRPRSPLRDALEGALRQLACLTEDHGGARRARRPRPTGPPVDPVVSDAPADR